MGPLLIFITLSHLSPIFHLHNNLGRCNKWPHIFLSPLYNVEFAGKIPPDSMKSMESWIWLGQWDLGKHLANGDLKKGCPSLSAARNSSPFTSMWVSPAGLQEDESPNHSSHPCWRLRNGNEATLDHPAPGKPSPPRITTQPTYRIMRSKQCCFKPLGFGMVGYTGKLIVTEG